MQDVRIVQPKNCRKVRVYRNKKEHPHFASGCWHACMFTSCSVQTCVCLFCCTVLVYPLCSYSSCLNGLRSDFLWKSMMSNMHWALYCTICIGHCTVQCTICVSARKSTSVTSSKLSFRSAHLKILRHQKVLGFNFNMKYLSKPPYIVRNKMKCWVHGYRDTSRICSWYYTKYGKSWSNSCSIMN